MWKSSLAVALPALSLGLALSHTTSEQRADARAAIAATLGSPVSMPTATLTVEAVPSYAAHVQSVVGPNSTAIDPDGLGQYETTMQIGGRTIPVLVDTGASYVALSFEDAASIGIHPVESDFRYALKTANGVARAAAAVVPSIRVGNVEAVRVPVVVSEAGALTGRSLLGMSFLRKLSGFQVQSNRLVLNQ